MLLPFPQDLPVEAIGIIVDKLRGKDIPHITAANAAWNLLGFAATQIVPKNDKIGTTWIGPSTDEESATMLEDLLVQFRMQSESGGVVDRDDRVKFIPWPIVIKILLGILAGVF